MGIITKFIKISSFGAAGSIGAFLYATKDAHFVPPSTTDYLFSSVHYKKFNPFNNPTMHDVCEQRVPLRQIRPELLEKEGKLAEAFCAGVWGGPGYTIQRLYLSRKYENNTTTAHQLWSPKALISSTYEPGTQITDHFEVVSKSPTSIVVRCGDSPMHNPTTARPSDGLFEMSAVIDREKSEAVFGLKSVFYQGTPAVEDRRNAEGPMPAHIIKAHQWYTKLWMWSALRNVKSG